MKAELRSVDGFTALSIAADLRRRDAKYRAGWWAGYLIGRASALDEAALVRSERAKLAQKPTPMWGAE